ncbi:MAG: toxin co-regulated pilus biosynthesis Q family protein [Candidatus Eutrophobiaceae bacterium]
MKQFIPHPKLAWLSFALLAPMQTADAWFEYLQATDMDAESSATAPTATIATPKDASGKAHKQAQQPTPTPKDSPSSRRDPIPKGSSLKSQKGLRTTPPRADHTVRVWKIAQGKTLQTTLENWSTQAHWQLIWELPNDYQIKADSSYVGNYQQALEQLLEDLSSAGIALEAEMYTSNQVLRIGGMR